MTRLLIKERGERKTTGLLYTSEATGYPIIVNTEMQLTYLMQQAKDLNINIPAPMTVRQLREQRGIRKPKNVLVDEEYGVIHDALQNYLGSQVVALTFTDSLRKEGNQC